MHGNAYNHHRSLLHLQIVMTCTWACSVCFSLRLFHAHGIQRNPKTTKSSNEIIKKKKKPTHHKKKKSMRAMANLAFYSAIISFRNSAEHQWQWAATVFGTILGVLINKAHQYKCYFFFWPRNEENNKPIKMRKKVCYCCCDENINIFGRWARARLRQWFDSIGACCCFCVRVCSLHRGIICCFPKPMPLMWM